MKQKMQNRPTPAAAASSQSNSEKTRVLFVGPGQFKPGVWDTRARYIYPDLLAPLQAQCDLHLLTSVPPPHAKPGLQHLEKKFSLSHHTPESISPLFPKTRHFAEKLLLKFAVRDPLCQWTGWSKRAAVFCRADVVSNVHGVLVFGVAAAQAGRDLGLRSLVRVPGDEIGARLEMGVYKQGSFAHKKELALEVSCFEMADQIAVMSSWEQERVQNLLAAHHDKVVVCPRGVDLERFTPKAKQKQAKQKPNNPGHLRILFLGRKSLEKGYDLAEAVAKVLAVQRPELSFVFAGTFSKTQEENRTYMGFVEAGNLPDLLQSCDILLMPSRTEGFPQALAEAMASGLPSIVPEHLFAGMFHHDRDVVLARLEVDALVAAIGRLADDPDLRQKLGQGARKAAQLKLDKTAFQALYARLMTGRNLQ